MLVGLDCMGAVLLQSQNDGELHPIAYASRTFSPCEMSYGITELETLVVVWVMSHFRTYLYSMGKPCCYRSFYSWCCSSKARLEWKTCLILA